MKLPNVAWKNMAAIGGVEMIRTVINRPMPPCCIDWLVKPSALLLVMAVMMSVAHMASATLTVSESTSELIKASTPIENSVPMP